MDVVEALVPYHAHITLAVVAVILIALVFEWIQADILFLTATVFLVACGIIEPKIAFSGFSSDAVVTVGALFVVAAALRETGLLDHLGRWVLEVAKTETQAMRRLSCVVVPLSAFLNNTPIVAMFMPIVLQWTRRNRVSPSKMLLPLSYLTLLGGTCTLIGTSTNMITYDQMIKSGMKPLAMFELSWVGVPCAAVGIIYLMTLGRRLLPERKDLLEQLGESRREYLAEMEVQPGCRLIGKSVEAAGLRHLPGLFLIEIQRHDLVIGPVEPSTSVESGDRLTFTGVVSSIVELEKIQGLVPATDSSYDVSPQGQRKRQLCEAVISHTSPLIGKTIREADFRATYGAAVVAVHRSGSRIMSKVGDIELHPGDTLLLQVRPSFLRLHRNDSAFVLISDVPEWRPLRFDRAWIAAGLFALLLVLMTFLDQKNTTIPIPIAGALIASAMVFCGCISVSDARQSIEWQVLITIGASFGVGAALQSSGAATEIAQRFIGLTGSLGHLGVLAGIYLIAAITTELITNNAVVILLFPICVEAAKLNGMDARPLIIALTIAASMSFVTPIGYQTNMMVYGPGGYKFKDYIRIGAPLSLIVFPLASGIIYLCWM